MALPATRVVTGKYTNPATQTAATGFVRLTPLPAVWTDTVNGERLPGGVELDLVAGQWSQALITTDAAGVEPGTNRYWQIEEHIDGQPVAAGVFALPTGDGSPVRVATLLDPDPGVPQYAPMVLSVNGEVGVVVLVPADIGALAADGGTLTGNLTVASSYDGTTSSDSTRRITLQSYQRATYPGHWGEPLRLDLLRDDAKAMIAWREGYTGNGLRSVAWIGAHGKSNDGLSWHNHISIEVPDLSGALQTALEIPYAQFNTPNGFGIAAADVYVRAVAKLIASGVPLIVEGSPGTNRDLVFGSTDGTNVGGKDAYKRWAIRADSVAETGSNAGSDLRWIRYNDLGAAIDSPIYGKRSNGFIGLGGNVSPQVQLDIGAANSGSWEARLNRGATTNSAGLSFATNAVVQWTVGMRNDSTNDLHVRDNVNGRTPWKVRTTGAVEAGLGFARGRTAVADANYTILTTDSRIAVTSITAARVITLPNVATATGQEFVIKDESGAADGTKTITVSGAANIDGAASKVINAAYGSLRVYSNGTAWFTY
ncbi:hypothetical protein ABT160_02755 [Streptomyces sp. NPDC001941]|uniref:hypothetical protein n=1 Tax=Streptomyces sp. NPDC001941 TaxID=3154659 RepID=UPI0033230347